MSELNENPSSPVESVSEDLPTTSKAAIASLIFGILSLFLSCLAGLPGVVLAIIAMAQIKKSNGLLRGSGLAVAGLVSSLTLSMVSLIIGILIGMLLPALDRAREASQRLQEKRAAVQVREALREEGGQDKAVERKTFSSEGPVKSAK